MTVYLSPKGKLGICSRNCEVTKEDNIYTQYIKYINFKIKEKGLAFQGELCGPGIQKNVMGFTEKKWLIFDIYDIINHRYLNWDEVQNKTKELGLECVPIISNPPDINFKDLM